MSCNNSASSELPEMKTVEYVDIERYMGDWYVIANIPTFIEKGATNAIESYRLRDGGIIETTFSFYEDSPDGEKKIYKPTGYIHNKETNAEWAVQKCRAKVSALPLALLFSCPPGFSTSEV